MHSWIVPTLLFVLLSPGLLLTLPAVGGKICCSLKTSYAAIAVHALVFAAVLAGMRYFGVITEGFEVEKAAKDAAVGAPKPGPKPEGEVCEKAEECQMGLFCASKKCSKAPVA